MDSQCNHNSSECVEGQRLAWGGQGLLRRREQLAEAIAPVAAFPLGPLLQVLLSPSPRCCVEMLLLQQPNRGPLLLLRRLLPIAAARTMLGGISTDDAVADIAFKQHAPPPTYLVSTQVERVMRHPRSAHHTQHKPNGASAGPGKPDGTRGVRKGAT